MNKYSHAETEKENQSCAAADGAALSYLSQVHQNVVQQ